MSCDLQFGFKKSDFVNNCIMMLKGAFAHCHRIITIIDRAHYRKLLKKVQCLRIMFECSCPYYKFYLSNFIRLSRRGVFSNSFFTTNVVKQ
jgi:hypothetical protein